VQRPKHDAETYSTPCGAEVSSRLELQLQNKTKTHSGLHHRCLICRSYLAIRVTNNGPANTKHLYFLLLVLLILLLLRLIPQLVLLLLLLLLLPLLLLLLVVVVVVVVVVVAVVLTYLLHGAESFLRS